MGTLKDITTIIREVPIMASYNEADHPRQRNGEYKGKGGGRVPKAAPKGEPEPTDVSNDPNVYINVNEEDRHGRDYANATRVAHTAQAVISKYDLDGGNAEISVEDGGRVYTTLEGDNNATVVVDLDAKDGTGTKEFVSAAKEALNGFDPDEEFDELWSDDFGKWNGFTPSQFMNMLREDDEQFEETADEMNADDVDDYLKNGMDD
jgi:hypothetical protein